MALQYSLAMRVGYLSTDAPGIELCEGGEVHWLLYHCLVPGCNHEQDRDKVYTRCNRHMYVCPRKLELTLRKFFRFVYASWKIYVSD